MSGFKSWRSFRDFNYAVRRKLRYLRAPEQEEFLRTVAETSHTRKGTLKEGDILWRARLGHDYREEQQDEHTWLAECAYSRDQMKPLPDKAYDGRANPKGIPCLYLANRKEVAVSEVRPWIGSYVSVGQFKLLHDVEFIYCALGTHKSLPIRFYLDEDPKPTPAEIEEAVWSDIDRAFAEPMTRSDDTADYVATQILSELFKREGFGGVAYKSNFGENGHNIALFDIEAADLINCGLYRVDSVDVKFDQCDNPYFVRKYYDDKKAEASAVGAAPDE
jgi:hypothetical protein